MKSLVAALAALAAAGCQFTMFDGPRIEGIGAVQNEDRSVASFSSIEAGSVFRVTVEKGEKAAVRVSAEENLIPHILAEVHGDTLTLRTDANLQPHKPIEIRVVVPSLDRLDISGACEAQVEGFSPARFDLETSGASSANLKFGSIGTLQFNGSGASKAVLMGSGLRELHAEASGASSLEVGEASLEVAEVSTSGAAQVRTKATAKRVILDSSGASTIALRTAEAGDATATGGSNIMFEIASPGVRRDASRGATIQP